MSIESYIDKNLADKKDNEFINKIIEDQIQELYNQCRMRLKILDDKIANYNVNKIKF